MGNLITTDNKYCAIIQNEKPMPALSQHDALTKYEDPAVLRTIIDPSEEEKMLLGYVDLHKSVKESIITSLKNFQEIRISIQDKEDIFNYFPKTQSLTESLEGKGLLSLPFKELYITLFGNYNIASISEYNNSISSSIIRSFYVKEVNPYKLEILIFGESEKREKETGRIFEGKMSASLILYYNNKTNTYETNNDDYSMAEDEIRFFLYFLCYQINSKKTVIHQVETNDAITIKRYPKKIRHQVRTVLYIHSKEEVIKNNKALKINLSCPYRFTVRGHWRKLENDDRVGKDREGNYTVQGFTWITDFIKGEKEKPLKETIRVIV